VFVNSAIKIEKIFPGEEIQFTSNGSFFKKGQEEDQLVIANVNYKVNHSCPN
jgi:hypothetical protein